MTLTVDDHRALCYFLLDYFANNEMWPSMRDIRDGIGVASTCTVNHRLRAAEAAGYVRRSEGKSRANRLTNAGWALAQEAV